MAETLSRESAAETGVCGKPELGRRMDRAKHCLVPTCLGTTGMAAACRAVERDSLWELAWIPHTAPRAVKQDLESEGLTRLSSSWLTWSVWSPWRQHNPAGKAGGDTEIAAPTGKVSYIFSGRKLTKRSKLRSGGCILERCKWL